MSFNIKLFVHGVPNGQCIWGNPGADNIYIEMFYGRKSKVVSQMILEVMQFGDETNAYYTYYYGNSKLVDNSGRPGGYFALTLRINFYYADIKNIYNLLEAAFNKYIIGSVLKHTPGGCCFMIPDFKQVNDNLKELEKELVHYLMQFSSNQDFISLSGFKHNGQNGIDTVNLLDVVPSVVVSHVKSKGNISVSPYYPSSKEQQVINKMNAEMQDVEANAHQQITAAQQKAQQDVLAAQRDKEQGISAVVNKYKGIDQENAELREQNDKLNKEIYKLNADVKNLNDKLQKVQDNESNYIDKQKKLEKAEKLIEVVKKELSKLIKELDLQNSVPDRPSVAHSRKKILQSHFGERKIIMIIFIFILMIVVMFFYFRK